MVQKIYPAIILLLIVPLIYVKPITAKQLSDTEFKPQSITPILPNCAIRTQTIGVPSPGFPMGDGGLFFTGVFLSNAKPYIWDLDVINNQDLSIFLISPAGTEVTISTTNGGDNSNVFNGTQWDDTAGNPVTDFVFTDGVTATNLVVEGALSAYNGESPNGIWKLKIIDSQPGNTGSLSSWALRMKLGASPLKVFLPFIIRGP